MELLTPAIGTIFWTSLVFLILVILLSKFAWKPILSSIKERETNIVDALNQATIARKEVENMKAENDRIIKEARIERDVILKEAREMKDKIVSEAKESAKIEGEKMLEAARFAIQSERVNAISDIKNQIGMLSLEVAESILAKELQSSDAQSELINNLVDKTKLN